MKNVLLCTPFFSEGDTGHYVLNSLSKMGYSVQVWDPRVDVRPPKSDFDVGFVWNVGVDPRFLRHSPKAYFFLDDPSFGDNKKRLNAVSKFYDYVFCVNKFDYLNSEWLPIGCDPSVHKPVELSDEQKSFYGSDVVFIGTLRDRARFEFVMNVSKLLKKEGVNMRVFGNGWGSDVRPVYFSEMNLVCNASKVVLNQHFSLGPSTKDMEIVGCGGGLLVNDDIPAIKEMFPNMPFYSSVKGAVEQIMYYLSNVKEREKLVGELREKAVSEFSYQVQLKKLFDKIS